MGLICRPWTGLLACAALAAGCGAPSPAEDLPPNLVLVSLDTLRATHLGCYGYERDTSPYLDRFAEESIVYDWAFATGSWTLLTNVSMLTGVGPLVHGVRSEELALNPGIPLLAERLQASGYQTYGHYFPGWVHPRHGFARGFDRFVEHPDAEVAMVNVAESLESASDRRPFFLFLHLFDVHSENIGQNGGAFYEPPPPFDDHFSPGALERAAAAPLHQHWTEKTQPAPEVLEDLVALYDGGIRYVDGVMEELLEGLRDEGVLDRTVVLITSDHGESLGKRGQITGHGGVLQEGMHIPMILRLPDGARGGERVTAPVSQVDVVPTLMELARLPADPRLTGVSMLGELDPARLLRSERFPRQAIVRFPLKLVDGKLGGAVYDLVEDYDERSALVIRDHEPDVYARYVAELKAEYETWLAEGIDTFDAPPVPAQEISEADMEALLDVGYLGD